MKPIKLICLATGWLVFAAAFAAEEVKTEPSSVLVQTRPPQRGEIADTLTAYGSAVPAINGGMTLSVPAEGRVMRIAVTPGEAVHAGQTLLEFHLSAAATSTHAQAVSAFTLAREQQAHTARLLAEQLATRDQNTQADKAVSDAQAALDALEHETGGKLQQTLTSPFDGVVGTVPVAQGDRVAAGAPLVTLTRSGGLVVTVGIEPSQRQRLRVGQSVQVESLGDDPSVHAGTIVRIDHALNPKTRLIDADVAVADELLQGEAFRARINVGRLNGWLVPRDAMLDDEDGAYVFQVAKGKAIRVNVKRIGSDAQAAVIDGPLDAQHALVVQGNYQLENGMSVREQPAPVGKEP